MKKFLLVTMILLCMMSAGCLEANSQLIITSDGAVHMKNKFIGVPLIANHIESFRELFDGKPNTEISPVAENNMSGYEVRVTYPNVDSFAAEAFPLFVAYDGKCKGIQKNAGWFFDAYNFDLISSGQRQLSPGEAATIQSVLSQISFDLVIELPYAADNHNADKVDAANKVLTWNMAPVLTGGGEKHMHTQFKIWHVDKIILSIIVGLSLLAAAIFFHVKFRAEQSDSLAKDLRFKRNVFAGLLIALLIISAGMILTPVTFSDADTISPVVQN